MQVGCRQPLSKPNGWLFWGILGVIAAPFVVGACATLIQAVGYEVRQLAVILMHAVLVLSCSDVNHTV